MPDFKFALGQRVNTFTGYADGLIVARTEDLDGNLSYLVSFANVDGPIIRQALSGFEIRAQGD